MPSQRENQADFSQINPVTLANDVAEFHRRGLDRRRFHDLTAEKYLLHVDAEGDNQWADLYNGERIQIPYNLSGVPRAQNNLLRPMVDNMVAYHTTMDFRYVVDCRPDREARESAAIDQAFANYIARIQRLNAVFAEAMYMAACYGHCPVHAFWRDDLSYDPYEPVHQPQPQDPTQQIQGPRKGTIDCFAGDPFDTIYATSSTRGSIERYAYGRVVNAKVVRDAFPNAPRQLSGSTRLNSASRFQRTARKWLQAVNSVHGTAALMSGHSQEELISLIYDETAPGIDPLYPMGRLSIIALDGSASTDKADGANAGTGTPVLLHDGPLPGGIFSSVQAYSANRFDDVHGKPYVADLDEDQIQLNQLETLVNEFVRRSVRAPLVTAGVIADDSAAYLDDGELEVDPSSPFMPHYLELPYRHIPLLENKINRLESGMFRKGGWQAASRGESQSGDSGAKVVALARADDTVHGPTNQRFRESAEAFMGICHRLAVQYMDVDWMMDIAGDELSHLVEPYINRTMLSPEPPTFRLTSGFGATTESKAQQLMDLWQMVDPLTGERAISTRQFKKMYPDRSLWPDELDPQEIRERRAKVVNQGIRKASRSLREQYGLDPKQTGGMGDPQVQQAAQFVWQQVDKQFPILMDDDIEANLEALSTMTQDESEDPIVRNAARFRQDQFFDWLRQKQEAAAEAAAEAAQAGVKEEGGEKKAARPRRSGPSRSQQKADPHGGTQTAEAMSTPKKEVSALTREAKGAAA